MSESEINDCRTNNDFKSKTFSKYGRSKVKNELLMSLYNNKIEPACYWSIELICAGHYHDLWDVLLLYISRYIHLGNPKLPIYIEMRFQNFKTVVQNGYIDNELSLRNNDKIRKLFAELICILCNSRKKHAFESLAIKDINDFEVVNLSRKLKAPNIQYAEEIFKKGDPKELFIAINEFAYHISNISKDITQACYWVEWILQFETICKQKKTKCNGERRIFIPVNEKHQMEVIWMIWDGLIKEAKKRNGLLYNKVIKALLNLFCIRYSVGSNRKKKYIIYHAISFLTEDINFNISLVEDKKFIESITNKINIIYKEVKKNEQSPKTDYLFTGIQKTNTEKTVEKIEKMNSILDKKIIF